MVDAPKKLITQKDIAVALGLSRGTVDRALHNREGISQGTKRRVIRKARELGYSPNKIAQLLVTGRTMNLAMITPGDPFWVRVKQGANSFLSELGGLVINIAWYETNVHDPVRESGIFKEVLKQSVHGIGIAPADPNLLSVWIDRAVAAGIPVVTLNTDSPQSKRLCYVGQDPLRAGKIAGELMGKFLKGRGTVVIITAFKKVLIHKLRLSAFREELSRHFPQVRILDIFENHDSSEAAYRITRNLLHHRPGLGGIYLTTGNGSGGAARALKETGQAGAVKVICFDFLSETVQHLKEGTVSAAIGEDPFNQGYQTVKLLYDYIADGKEPTTPSVFTKIDIGLRGNIDSLV